MGYLYSLALQLNEKKELGRKIVLADRRSRFLTSDQGGRCFMSVNAIVQYTMVRMWIAPQGL
jgi:hypothetical protein